MSGSVATAIDLINLINDDAFVLAATADLCSMVHLVCLFMKIHQLALLQDSCLDLAHCVFLRTLSACMRNITVFCQHLLRPTPISETQILAQYISQVNIILVYYL